MVDEEITRFIFTDILSKKEKEFNRKEFLDKAKKTIAELKDIEEEIKKVQKEMKLKRFKLPEIKNFSFISGVTPEKSWYWGWGIIIARKAKGVKQEERKYSPEVDNGEKQKLYILWGILPGWPSRGKKGIEENMIKKYKKAVKILKEKNKKPDDIFKYEPITIDDDDLKKIKKGEINIIINKLSENKDKFNEVKKDLDALKDDFVELIKKFNNSTTQGDVVKSTTQSKNSDKSGRLTPILTALRTKPFLILAGVSGTGKTQIARIVAGVVSGEN